MIDQVGPNKLELEANNLMKAKKAAAFTIVDMKEVNTLGAPSYTSGVQKWKGAADTLKDIAANKIKSPATCKKEAV